MGGGGLSLTSTIGMFCLRMKTIQPFLFCHDKGTTRLTISYQSSLRPSASLMNHRPITGNIEGAKNVWDELH